MYEQDIVLEDGLVFHFKCYYFKTEGVWEVAFEDQDEKAHQVSARFGEGQEGLQRPESPAGGQSFGGRNPDLCVMHSTG